MNPALAYILARLGEASTYRGIFAILTAIGLAIKPEQAAAITSLGLAAIGTVNVFKKDAVVKVLLATLCLLPLASCGLTKEQWAGIGKDVLLREAPIVYGEVQQAKTAAKNPVKVTP